MSAPLRDDGRPQNARVHALQVDVGHYLIRCLEEAGGPE